MPGKFLIRVRIPFIWLTALILLMSACIPAKSTNGSQGKALQSKLQRIQNPEIPEDNLTSLVSGNTSFAVDLFHVLPDGKKNLFFSPYSISAALAMTYAGARNQTADQMAKVLYFELPQAQLHPAFNALDQMINQDQGARDKDQQPFELEVANSLWGQQDHPFKQEYLDLLAQNYGAGLRMVDFVNEAENARLQINQWVSDQTNEKIKDLIPMGGVTAASRLVLANAIYFKADWLYPFEKTATSNRPFYLLDDNQVDVATMSFDHAKTLPYLAGKGFQAVELPYIGEETSMLIIVPEQDHLAAIESSLDAAQLEQILQQTQDVEVQLYLPKFEYSTEYPLADFLAEMGMPDAFCGGEVDFSGMDEQGNLCISQVFHKAFVAVDEKGTEAAAASAVVMEASAIMGDQPVVLNVDRPFIFLILHKPSNSILFMGRVLDPRPTR
jgi:serpin B